MPFFRRICGCEKPQKLLLHPNCTQVPKVPFCKSLKRMAGTTGLEPAASAVTGQRSNQLNYVPVSLRENCPGCLWSGHSCPLAEVTSKQAAKSALDLKNGGRCRTRTCDLLGVSEAL